MKKAIVFIFWLFSSKLLVKNVKNLDSLAQCCNFQKNNEL